MSFDPTVIREALAARIKAGISRDVNVYPYDTPKVMPCICIREPSDYLAYHQSFGDDNPLVAMRLVIDIITTAPSEDGQLFLDALRAVGTAASVPDAIEEDRTLGGVIADCIVRNGTGRQRYEAPGVDGYYASLNVSIYRHKGA